MHSRSIALSTAAAVTAVTALIGFGTPPASSEEVTETFEFSGEAEPWVVPAGVCEITAVANGAEGGDAGGPILAGLGGRATATLEVTPGETLYVTVGGAGESGVGGFNGGGDGAVGFNDGTSYGGGGASDIRQGGPDLEDRVLVAGGGGGRSNGSGTGGDGGGEAGEPGGGSGGGGGGTQSAGGAAGGSGTSGSLGQGGDGSNGGDDAATVNVVGGGGGGGYYGGGGGSALEDGLDGSGGGGGSGFGPAGTELETGVWGNVPGSGSIDGLVEITYDPAAGTCPAEQEPPAAQPVADEPDFTG